MVPWSDVGTNPSHDMYMYMKEILDKIFLRLFGLMRMPTVGLRNGTGMRKEIRICFLSFIKVQS